MAAMSRLTLLLKELSLSSDKREIKKIKIKSTTRKRDKTNKTQGRGERIKR
jgi:hypothetical protein